MSHLIRLTQVGIAAIPLAVAACGPTAVPNVHVNLPAYPAPPAAAPATGPTVRVDAFHDRVARPNGGTLTVYDMSMGNVVFDPQIATILEDAVAAELAAAGMKVVRQREDDPAPPPADFVVTGAVEEFVVSSPTGIIDWDVKLDMRVSLGLFRGDGQALQPIAPISAKVNEHTMIHPGQDIIARLAKVQYERFRSELLAPRGLVQSIRGATLPAAPSKQAEVRP